MFFQLKVVHWNCFKLTQLRQFELENFLNNFKPDIISLQEIKINEEKARMYLNFPGYNTFIKTRSVNPEWGGGVAILIRSWIPHSPITDLDDSLEMIGLKIELKEVCFDFFSFYSPPNQVIPYEFFSSLEVRKVKFILVGDLNSKSESIGCKSQDPSGSVLDKILTDTSIIIHNDQTPTYYQFRGENRTEQYSEILDIVMSSCILANKIVGYEVLVDQNMESDHCPITFNIQVNGRENVEKTYDKNRFNFAKANWVNFRNILEENSNNIRELESLSIDDLNDLISKQILNAVEKSVPKCVIRGNNSLPKEIVDLIKLKRDTRRAMKKINNQHLKTFYNKLTSQIKKLIKEYKEKIWLKMLEKIGPYPVSSKIFWEKINQSRSKKLSTSMPILVKDSIEYKTDQEKSTLFGDILNETYATREKELEFDKIFKKFVDEEVVKHKFLNDFIPFSTFDIIKAIRKIKIISAPGGDQIQNIVLKNIPYDYISKVLSVLVNRSIESGIPIEWKKANIKMIPKGGCKSKDPEKYRPISLTSCLGKLVERLVKTRLYKFLEEGQVLAKQQSGFRNNKGSSDNLVFFTQKISETLNKKKKACGIFFDISKAFDKVWHNGLIYKLINLNIPSYILKYVTDFLKNRVYRVNVDNSFSEFRKILCSVPQGSVLGPLLFLVYINDIPLADSKHMSYSSLFADDLSTIFFYKKKSFITSKIKTYLKSLVEWLFKWRLKMNASKCCYTIFSGAGSRNKDLFEFNLSDGKIPYNPNPVFLGITFDEFLNFRKHTDLLEKRARKRLNIIKIFSHKSWHLSPDTLKGIYNALIGSIFTYSFFAIARIAKTNIERLQRVQNRAIRSIYRLDWTSPSDLIHEISGLTPISERLIQLGERYLAKAVLNNKQIALLLKEYIDSKSSILRNGINTPLCLFYKTT